MPGAPNSWNANVIVNPQSDVFTNTTVGFGDAAPEAGGPSSFVVNFSNNGTLLSAVDEIGNESGATGQVQMFVAFDVPNTSPDEDGGQV